MDNGIALKSTVIDIVYTIYIFLCHDNIYPEILKKAQAEVDAVIGQDRLPTFEDRDALPYVNAICVELLRWQVVGSFGMYLRAYRFRL